MTWLEQTMNSFHLHGNAPNLLNTHQECKLTLTLSEKTYSKWMSKFFSLFNSYCMLAALNMTSRGMDYSTTEVKREAQGILLRSAQLHYRKDIHLLSDSQVSGVRTMSIRLQSRKAIELFGARHLPILSSNDPLRMKVMRHGHEMGNCTFRRMHNLEKTTNAEILKGEFGLTWKKQMREVKSFISKCGICKRFRGDKCRPLIHFSEVGKWSNLLRTCPWTL